MAVVYSNLEDDVSLYEELLGLEGAYSALSELLWELSSDHVSRDHVTRILDPLNKRFALICERVQIEEFGSGNSKEVMELRSVEAG
jgi:hypothetical protein